MSGCNGKQKMSENRRRIKFDILNPCLPLQGENNLSLDIKAKTASLCLNPQKDVCKELSASTKSKFINIVPLLLIAPTYLVRLNKQPWKVQLLSLSPFLFQVKWKITCIKSQAAVNVSFYYYYFLVFIFSTTVLMFESRQVPKHGCLQKMSQGRLAGWLAAKRLPKESSHFLFFTVYIQDYTFTLIVVLPYRERERH